VFTWYVTNLLLTMRIDWKGEMEYMCRERVVGSFEILLRYLQKVGLLRKPTKNLIKCSLILYIIRSLNCPGIQDRNITGRATLLCAHMHKDVRIFTHIN